MNKSVNSWNKYEQIREIRKYIVHPPSDLRILSVHIKSLLAALFRKLGMGYVVRRLLHFFLLCPKYRAGYNCHGGKECGWIYHD